MLRIFTQKASLLSQSALLTGLCLAATSPAVGLDEYSGSNNTVLGATTVTLFLPVVSSVYPKLADKLEAALRKEQVEGIEVKNVDFWHPYQQGLRRGRVGVYFAQPHFAAWAINKHSFLPVYKLHGRLKYVLAAPRDNQSLFEVRDLAGKTLCREPGLNLGTVWLNDLLGKHRVTAQSAELPSVEKHMQNIRSNAICDAFVIDDFAYDRINEKQRGRFIRLAQSPEYKHNAFVAHPDIAPQTIARLKQALKSKAVKKVINPYFEHLSKWQNLLPPKISDYHAADSKLLDAYWDEQFKN